MDSSLARADTSPVDDRFVFHGARRTYAAFPLGGLGSGSVSLTGSGRLVDWSIRNRPAIHQYNGYSHFAIKAERDGKLLDARVLNGPYEGNPTGSPSVRKFDGYGFGANRDSMTGLPHFDDATMIGRFPVAEISFVRPEFPGRVRMTAFSPFIPHNDRDSSLPAALFAIEVENDTSETIDYTVAATLGNYGCDSGVHTFIQDGALSALHFTSADSHRPAHQRGDLALTTEGDDVEHVDYHLRGQWFDSLGAYWREFARPGPLRERRYDEPRATANMFQQPEHGTLARRIRLAPGARTRVRFAITWNFPLGSIYWFSRAQPGDKEFAGDPPNWRNYYATQWAHARASGAEALRRWDELEAATSAFCDTLFSSSLPPEIVDAVAGTLAVLRTATIIRLEGGELWGWEGQHTAEGSCEGSCTHVWNYQQALAYLFPSLERSLRETEFAYNQLPNGGLTFRQRLPLGSSFDIIGPCADGHFGAMIKTYREWKNCGDDAWLKRLWPKIRRAMEYAWSADNPDRWDPDRTGVLWGRQHHTLDMELFGPNSWLTTMYLAALKATAHMASALGEETFARECEDMARRGGAYVDANLFADGYYAQKLDLSARDMLAPFDRGRKAGVLRDTFMDAYWSKEYGEIKYQIGAGCLTDQLLGQWHADLAGLGDLLSPVNVQTALKRIYRENYRPSLRDHVNPCRVYAYEDEAGLLVCSWPEGTRKPAIPVPYAEEVWTGLEYMLASHLVARGLVEEGLTIVRSARARHDGVRRNPWNDIECGSHYARSLSSYALLNAYTGLSFDQRRGEIGFAPARPGDGVYLWSVGRGWGEIAFEGPSVSLVVKGGRLSIERLRLPGFPAGATLDGVRIARDGDDFLLGARRTLRPGDKIVLRADVRGQA